MKKIKLAFVTAVICLLFSVTVYGESWDSYTQIFGKYQKDHLTITSFSEKWTEQTLEAIYAELLENFHGEEFLYLRDIYLYPDSPEGIDGRHTNQISINESGVLEEGYACIELYGMDDIPEVEGIAAVLSHEYGHHYTLYNISRYENLLYTQWQNSEYAALRSLEDYSIYYDLTDEAYEYTKDITEIAANDYVQLLGSPSAKRSYIYRDSQNLLELGLGAEYAAPLNFFNCMPQRNMELSLATEVDGLYNYFIKISGGAADEPVHAPAIGKSPVILDIPKEPSYLYYKYTLHFSQAEGNAPFEYTVVMYRLNEPYTPIPIKTIGDEELPEAVFGSVYRVDTDGTIYGVFEAYTGVYAFRVFARDSSGFVYSSQVFVYDFGNIM